MADLHGLTLGQVLQIGWQGAFLWHAGAVDEHGDDAHPSLECRTDLLAHEVVGGLQPNLALLIGKRGPLRPHDRQHDFAAGQTAGKRHLKVIAGVELVDVHEDGCIRKRAVQIIVDAARHAGIGLPSVVDEYVAKQGLPLPTSTRRPQSSMSGDLAASLATDWPLLRMQSVSRLARGHMHRPFAVVCVKFCKMGRP
ncbi:hypothetical protein X749_31460 [Mesorhizobium sp. LNJC391B00]|nr:hypothetical protein X749_31460 [Mesorhizobium sp. LNJC391B00]